MKFTFPLLLITVIVISQIRSFQISGAFNIYNKTSEIKIYANEMDSETTLIPFDFFYLKQCQPHNKSKYKHDEETLGSLIMGDTKSNTAYQAFLLEQEDCKKSCTQRLSKKDVNNFIWMIERDYRVSFVIDDLPSLYENKNGVKEIGFPLGFYNEKKTKFYLNNHLNFIIKYHEIVPRLRNQKQEGQVKKYSIVGFEIIPESIKTIELKNETDKKSQFIPSCQLETENDFELPQELDQATNIAFSYSVTYQASDIDLATRWDVYRQGLGDDEIHWFALLNSSVINIFLTAILAHIMKRVLNKDIEKYQQVSQSEEIELDSGWKQLQMDVFRSPKNSILISVFSGVGLQILLMVMISLLFIVLGIENQNQRGAFLNSLIVCFVFLGGVAGYWTARIYKMHGGVYWLRATALVSLLYPGLIMIVFCGINFLLHLEQSSMAIHFHTLLYMAAIWLGISSPLVFIGAFMGYKRSRIEYPTRVNPVPSYIPPQPTYVRSKFTLLLGGLLPFGSMLIELNFIMQSIWHHNFYYLFMFLFFVMIILIITCAEISIVITYLQLCHGNYKWQWRAFLTPAMCGGYIFGFSIYYWLTQLQIVRFSSIMMYFGFMSVISFTFFLFCGSVGYLASTIFLRRIYSLIKVD